MTIAFFAIAAYLIGSLSFAVLVSRAFGLPDPGTYGSGNPGATNVLRTGRKAAALLTLVGDGGKGWLAVFAVKTFAAEYGVGEVAIAVVSLTVLVGHVYPVFFHFRGGKGVATALGVLLALDVWLGLGALMTWLLIFAFFRISSLSAICAALFAPFFEWWIHGPGLMTVTLVLISLLLLQRHRENIRRLLVGEEGRIEQTQEAGSKRRVGPG